MYIYMGKSKWIQQKKSHAETMQGMFGIAQERYPQYNSAQPVWHIATFQKMTTASDMSGQHFIGRFMFTNNAEKIISPSLV